MPLYERFSNVQLKLAFNSVIVINVLFMLKGREVMAIYIWKLLLFYGIIIELFNHLWRKAGIIFRKYNCILSLFELYCVSTYIARDKHELKEIYQFSLHLIQ